VSLSFSAIRNWLAGAAVNLAADAAMEPAPGTGEWFLPHPNVVNWLDSKSSDLLWVKGEPGKSQLIQETAIPSVH
jgi:hypothetical protein